jgi:hypothetical protein
MLHVGFHLKNVQILHWMHALGVYLDHDLSSHSDKGEGWMMSHAPP